MDGDFAGKSGKKTGEARLNNGINLSFLLAWSNVILMDTFCKVDLHHEHWSKKAYNTKSNNCCHG